MFMRGEFVYLVTTAPEYGTAVQMGNNITCHITYRGVPERRSRRGMCRRIEAQAINIFKRDIPSL
jgi:hypothetical protein